MFESTDLAFATAYYHWFMMLQPPPPPDDGGLSSGQLRTDILCQNLFAPGFADPGGRLFDPLPVRKGRSPRRVLEAHTHMTATHHRRLDQRLDVYAQTRNHPGCIRRHVGK